MDWLVPLSFAAILAVACKSGDDDGSSDSDGEDSSADAASTRFSFFVTSLAALRDLSGNENGFGGDLRFGETGAGAGLRGADKICAAIAERSLPGSSAKQWRAFLSATADENGDQVNALERIGQGPWYDRLGRLLAPSLDDLRFTRPQNGDAEIADDFPNEDGVPNHQPDTTQAEVDNHDMLSGTDLDGNLYAADATCLDWTSAEGDIEREGKPRVGHSWPRGDSGMGGPIGCMIGDGGPPPGPPPGDAGPMFPGDGGPPPCMRPDGDGGPIIIGPGDGGVIIDPGDGGLSGPEGEDINSWMSSLTESGCAPGVNVVETGPPNPNENTVGSGGGYGGFYCFALVP